MEEEKLLRALICIISLIYSSIIYADNNVDVSSFQRPGKIELQFANELLDTTKHKDLFLDHAMDLTKQAQGPMSCRFDIDGMPCGTKAIPRNLSHKRIPNNLFIFASLSLTENTLIELAEQAKKYNGIIVFRGFKNGSFKEMITALRNTIEKSGSGVIIDPTLFTQYDITAVPSFVVTDHQSHDKLSGNVTIDFALGKIAEQGELKILAQQLLEDGAA